MDYSVKNTEIRIGTSLSLPLDLGEDAYSVAIGLPGNWTAANLTFQGCATPDGEYRELNDVSGNAYTVTASAGKWHSATALSDTLRPFRFIKVRSGTVALPVNQTGDVKYITVIVKSA